MTIFDPDEKVELLAGQSLNYDRYTVYQYFLERVQVNGKCGLACEEESEGGRGHAKILLPPIYNEIKVRKISSHKAIYTRYEVFANGRKVGIFTLVLNAWVEVRGYQNN